MSNTRAVWSFVLCLTAIRLTLLGTTDLTFDEAHYWMWSERLAPAYFSKGPGVAFAIRASTMILERTSSVCAFSVRCLAPEQACFCFIWAAECSTPQPRFGR